jgi:uncharacterized protein (DUF2147 family)
MNSMKRYVLIFSFIFSGYCLAAQAGNPDQIIGVWKSSGSNLMVKIDKVGNHFQGRIVWIDDTNENEPVLDKNNPEERLREMPLKGNKIIQQLSFDDSKSIWDGGTFYNYMEGKLYNCQISVNGSQIKITKFSQNAQDGIVETWTRQ